VKAVWIWAPVLAGAVVLTQQQIDKRLGVFRAQEESLYFWSGEQVKRMVPGFETLAADIYWLRTVQYFGGQRLFAQGKRFELLEPLIDITTSLDPRLEIAYRYGAVFLCEPPPTGAGRPLAGIAVLERGAANLPQSWRLRQDLGFFTFLFLKQPQRAAEILTEARKIPGAPFWLESLAADTLSKGGDRQAARRMWRQMYEQAEEGILKANAQDRLSVLDALDQADRLTTAVAEFERQFGRRPRELEELVARGVTRDAIVDSTGVPFAYDPGSGKVKVAETSRLWRPE
jgi:hypothetical protein